MICKFALSPEIIPAERRWAFCCLKSCMRFLLSSLKRQFSSAALLLQIIALDPSLRHAKYLSHVLTPYSDIFIWPLSTLSVGCKASQRYLYKRCESCTHYSNMSATVTGRSYGTTVKRQFASKSLAFVQYTTWGCVCKRGRNVDPFYVSRMNGIRKEAYILFMKLRPLFAVFSVLALVLFGFSGHLHANRG